MLQVDGANLYYQDQGPRDAPAILLLHALGADAAMWDAQVAPLLAAGWRVLRYDVRGHGRSVISGDGDAAIREFSIADLAGDALAVLDAAELSRAVWLGLSIGGMTALWAAAMHPERVSALIVSNASPGPAPREMWQSRIGTALAQGMAPLVEPTLARWFTAEFRERAPTEVERIRIMLKAVDPRAYASCCAAIRDQDQRESLRRIGAPTLVIAGAADTATPPAIAEVIGRAIAGSQVQVLPAAHLSNVEATDAFNALLMPFIARQVVGARTSRRALLAGAVAAAGSLALTAVPRSTRAASDGAAISSAEFWAKKGPVSLYMYRKWQGSAKPGGKSKPVVFLVHGSSLASRTSFDLKGGGADYSMMDELARAGFDVWTMDHENYGHSSRTESNSDLASGAADLQAGMEVIRRETGERRAHFFALSSGSLRTGIFATQHPEAVNRLALGGLTYTGVGSPTLVERAKQLDFYRTHNRRPRGRDMVASIFTRDGMPAIPELVDALVSEEMKYGDSVPTGTYLDMCSKLPAFDPAQIRAPVLIIRGEHDGIATVDDLLEFYRKLPGNDKQFAIVAGAHSLTQGPGYRQVWHTVAAFFSMPVVAPA